MRNCVSQIHTCKYYNRNILAANDASTLEKLARDAQSADAQRCSVSLGLSTLERDLAVDIYFFRFTRYDFPIELVVRSRFFAHH